MALRRWKPFLSAFPLIDAAIESSDAGGLLSRDEFRSARARILELLCDAEDGEMAEGICALLDEAMAESLVTLRAVPAEKIELASGDLVGAVGALMRDHASERVCGVAHDVVRGWKANVGAELAKARAAMDALEGLSTTPPPPLLNKAVPGADSDTKAKKIQPRPRKIDTAPLADSNAKAMMIPEKHFPTKTTVITNSRRVTESYAPLRNEKPSIVHSTNNAKPPASNIGASVPTQPKKTPAIIVSSVAEEEEKMKATKRKLRELYKETEDAKRRRKTQMMKATTAAAGQKATRTWALAADEGLVRCSSAQSATRAVLSDIAV